MSQETLQLWKQAIKRRGFYCLLTCPFCGVGCGWFYEGDQLMYTSACDCTSRPSSPRPAEDEDMLFYLEPEMNHLTAIEKFIKE